MAIVVPTTLELLAANVLIGHVPADSPDPLRLIIERSHWHYTKHRPPIVNFCGVQATAETNLVYEFPAHVSADGIEYLLNLRVVSTSAGSMDLLLEVSPDGVTYGTHVSITLAVVSGLNDSTTVLPSVPASTRYMRLSLDQVGSETFQLQSCIVVPREFSAITSGIKPSGFIGLEDTAILTTGAAVHTEYLNRGWKNFRVTTEDRRHVVLSYVAPLNIIPTFNFIRRAGRTHFYAGYGVASLLGRTTTSLTVKAKADFVTDPGTIIVGQVGGKVVTLLADGTHQTGTLDIEGDTPILFISILPGASGNIRPRYITADFAPTIGSADLLVADVAPPARLEYLRALDALSLQATLGPYAIPCVVFNAEDFVSPTTAWSLGHILPPGIDAARGAFGRSSDGNANVTQGPTLTTSTDSGPTANDVISTPAAMPGNPRFPPDLNSHVIFAAEVEDTAPSAPRDRLYEVVQSRRAQYERYTARLVTSHSVIPRRVVDPSTLPI